MTSYIQPIWGERNEKEVAMSKPKMVIYGIAIVIAIYSWTCFYIWLEFKYHGKKAVAVVYEVTKNKYIRARYLYIVNGTEYRAFTGPFSKCNPATGDTIEILYLQDSYEESRPLVDSTIFPLVF